MFMRPSNSNLLHGGFSRFLGHKTFSTCLTFMVQFGHFLAVLHATDATTRRAIPLWYIMTNGPVCVMAGRAFGPRSWWRLLHCCWVGNIWKHPVRSPQCWGWIKPSTTFNVSCLVLSCLVLWKMFPVKMILSLKALLSQIMSDGYQAAVSNSNSLNFGRELSYPHRQPIRSFDYSWDLQKV